MKSHPTEQTLADRAIRIAAAVAPPARDPIALAGQIFTMAAMRAEAEGTADRLLERAALPELARVRALLVADLLVEPLEERVELLVSVAASAHVVALSPAEVSGAVHALRFLDVGAARELVAIATAVPDEWLTSNCRRWADGEHYAARLARHRVYEVAASRSTLRALALVVETERGAMGPGVDVTSAGQSLAALLGGAP